MLLKTAFLPCHLQLHRSLTPLFDQPTWKIAEVTPILKDGNREIPNNCRPIALLPVLSKICERVTHDQLISYLTANQCLTAKQCANKKLNSTETSIIQTTDVILDAIDK